MVISAIVRWRNIRNVLIYIAVDEECNKNNQVNIEIKLIKDNFQISKLI